MALVKKLTKIGNSTGVILPADLMSLAGIGEDAEVELSLKENGILVQPIKLKDHKIMKTFMGVIKDYDETFKKLAK